MIYKNKKGDIFVDITFILVSLFLFWQLYPVLDAMALEMAGITGNSLESWLLRSFSFFLLVGIVRYISLGVPNFSGGGTEE